MHVAIIMNGNSRWAARRGLPAVASHVEGAAALRNAVKSAQQAGIKTLTVYALRSPKCASFAQELDADVRVLEGYLRSESGGPGGEQSVRISVIGDCEHPDSRLPWRGGRHATSEATDSRMHLRIVIDYSAHDSVVQSSWRSAHPLAAEHFAQRLREIDHTALSAGAVDLLIRTGDGPCHSDFMLWEVAYARLHRADCLWPDFTAHDFTRALTDYSAGNQS
jgi:undecaprenyl diphosphate synthase